MKKFLIILLIGQIVAIAASKFLVDHPVVSFVSPPQRREIFWIDVRDHTPRDLISVLVAFRGGEIEIARVLGGIWISEAGFQVPLGSVITHWADLPEGPKA